MKVGFELMPGNARVWIYQASNELNAGQQKELEDKASSFLETWDSHGNPLKASWKLFYNRFLVIAVDPSFNTPSGCSIDTSVRFLRELEAALGISLLDKSSVAVMENNNQIATFQLKEIKDRIREGVIKESSLIFNNLITSMDELNHHWKVPASQSWLSRNFN